MNSGAIITDGLLYLYTTLDHCVGLMGVQVRDCHGSLTKYKHSLDVSFPDYTAL